MVKVLHTVPGDLVNLFTIALAPAFTDSLTDRVLNGSPFTKSPPPFPILAMQEECVLTIEFFRNSFIEFNEFIELCS